jgi:hypothetical protein
MGMFDYFGHMLTGFVVTEFIPFRTVLLIALTVEHLEKVTGSLSGKGSLLEIAIGDKKPGGPAWNPTGRPILYSAGRKAPATDGGVNSADGRRPLWPI